MMGCVDCGLGGETCGGCLERLYAEQPLPTWAIPGNVVEAVSDKARQKLAWFNEKHPDKPPVRAARVVSVDADIIFLNPIEPDGTVRGTMNLWKRYGSWTEGDWKLRVPPPPKAAWDRLDTLFVTKFKCRACGCFWRKNDDGSWSLYDAKQSAIMGKCCDNSTEFLSLLDPAEDA